MTITSKQRAFLKGLAQTITPAAQFGKGELTGDQITMIEQLLVKRELIKCSVLETSPYTARELCALICEKTDAAPVQVICRRFVIYRPNPENPVIRPAK